MGNVVLEEYGVEVHPVAAVFAFIQDGWSEFVADVEANGVFNPITWSSDGSVLVDGRNRLAAWIELGRDVESCPSVRLAEGVDEFAFIASSNIARRHMSPGQRAFTAGRAYGQYAERARVRMMAGVPHGNVAIGSGPARDEASRDFQVGQRYVDHAVSMLAAAEVDVTGRVGELVTAVESGALTMSAAKKKFDEMDYSPAKAVQPGADKFAALAKAIKGMDSGDGIQAIRMIADAIGVAVTVGQVGEYTEATRREALAHMGAIAQAAGIQFKVSDEVRGSGGTDYSAQDKGTGLGNIKYKGADGESITVARKTAKDYS